MSNTKYFFCRGYVLFLLMYAGLVLPTARLPFRSVDGPSPSLFPRCFAAQKYKFIVYLGNSESNRNGKGPLTTLVLYI